MQEMGELENRFDSVRDLVGLEEIADPQGWVCEFFKREELYLRSLAAPVPLRPLGSMRKKEVVWRGARSERVAAAYAHWNTRVVSDRSMSDLLSVYNAHFFDRPLDSFLDEYAPRTHYERLVVLTPRALYSGKREDEVNVFRFGFDNTYARIDDLDSAIALDTARPISHAKLPAVFEYDFLPGEPESAREAEPFRAF